MNCTEDIERILIDVDGTICNNLPRGLEYVEDEYGIEVSPDDITEWEYQFDELGITLTDVFDYLMEERAEWYMQDLRPIESARNALDVLSSEGYEIWIVTHRHPETHHLTQQWLDEHNFTYDRYVSDVPASKSDVPGDVLIDDFHGHVHDAAEADMYGVLLDRPYNRLMDHKRSFVATNWEDIVDRLATP